MKTNTSKIETPESETSQDHLPGERRLSADRFFRVSKVVDSLKMLDGWVEWFKLRNIPCVITRKGRGYSLWRGGEEIGGDENISLSVLMKKTIVYSSGLLSQDEAETSMN
jgi:hypothetical protein